MDGFYYGYSFLDDKRRSKELLKANIYLKYRINYHNYNLVYNKDLF